MRDERRKEREAEKREDGYIRKNDEKLAARMWERKRYSILGGERRREKRGERQRPGERECEIRAGQGGEREARRKNGMDEWGGRTEEDRELFAHK